MPSLDPESWQKELDTEGPLLLNPYFDSPEEHITFDRYTGVPEPLTERGKATIECCELDRPSLAFRRLDSIDEGLYAIGYRMLQQTLTVEEAIPATKEFSMWRRFVIRYEFQAVWAVNQGFDSQTDFGTSSLDVRGR